MLILTTLTPHIHQIVKSWQYHAVEPLLARRILEHSTGEYHRKYYLKLTAAENTFSRMVIQTQGQGGKQLKKGICVTARMS